MKGEINMTKLLATLIAAVFFSVSMGSIAIAAAPDGDAPKAEAKKKVAKAKKPAKAKKAAKAKKPAKKSGE